MSFKWPRLEVDRRICAGNVVYFRFPVIEFAVICGIAALFF